MGAVELPMANTTTRKIRPTFFETLDGNSLENIVRFSSDKPHSDKWTCFVPLTLVETLSELHDTFAALVPVLFRSLEWQDIEPRHKSGLVVYGTETTSPHQFRVLHAILRPNLREIHITSSFSPSFPYTYAGFTSPSPAMTLAQILSPCSATLRVLELSWATLTKGDVDAIEHVSENLRHISLEFHTVDPTAHLDRVWMRCGANLKELRLCSTEKSRFVQYSVFLMYVLPDVQRHCVGLRHIAFQGMPLLFTITLGDLCAGLGAQLDKLELASCHLDENCLRLISDSCTNARVSLSAFEGVSVQALFALGSRAVDVHIGSKTVESATTGSAASVDILCNIGTSCPNLESIAIWSGDLSFVEFRALFSSPMPKLTHFSLHYSFLDCGACFLGALSEYTHSLEHLEVSVFMPSMSSWDRIIAANPHLQSVRMVSMCTQKLCLCSLLVPGLCRDVSELIEVENWRELLGVFTRCKSLKELEFSCVFYRGLQCARMEKMTDAFYEARRQGISITICGCHFC